MINRRVLGLFWLFVPLAACVHGDDTSTPGAFQVKFAPLADIGPFPNDLYFNHSDGSANTTGTLSILPIGSSTTGTNAPIASMDHLDGFGTQSDIDIYFNAPVDATTLAANVVVLKVASSVTNKAVNPAGTVTPLVVGSDYSIGLSPATDDGGQTVVITPLKPLAASAVVSGSPVPATYLVIVTGGVKDKNGDAVTASPDYAAILKADLPVLSGGTMGSTGNTTLDQVALFTLPQLAIAEKIAPNNIALTFSFSTQFLGLSLAELAANATATTQPAGTGLVDTGKTDAQILAAAGVTLTGTALAAAQSSEIYAGTVAIPYYLQVPTTGNPTAALTDNWTNALNGGDTVISTNPLSELPKATVAQNVIPALVSIPLGCGAMPTAGWPVAIFQHGITRNREDMFAIAGAVAAPPTCTAVIAIDLPLHGVTNTTDLFYKNQLFKGTPAAAVLTAPVSERTFDMDLENNTTLAAGPDGQIDTSGAWFINLTSTITSRDNLREGAADLINLAATLPNIFPGGTNKFDPTKVFYIGHSLGGIVGTVFLGADSTTAAQKIKAATLANPGGHIAELLRNSAEFGPIIDGQLAANGLAKGTLGYYSFYSEAQAVVEDGDPANYAVLAASKHPIHMIEVVGDGTTANPPDQVVPNSATDLLVSLMKLKTINTVGLNPIAAGVGNGSVAKFTAGDHGSLLSPAAPTSAQATTYAGVTAEMQGEAASVEATLGAAVSIAVNSFLK